MYNNNILILGHKEVEEILSGKENEIIEIVKNTYCAHENKKSSLPHSIFLRFPDDNKNRIIGLPAYIELNKKMAGMKWISSFPDNINNGLERASAVLVLNNMDNGYPEAILESSIISAKRTAASATLAAVYLHKNKHEKSIGIVGGGRINFEILSFMFTQFKEIEKIYLYDKSQERAKHFVEKFSTVNKEFILVNSLDEVMKKTKLISFATTAGVPYIDQIANCTYDNTILNISLRDFSPNVIKNAYNIVDDLDHVCREKTSIHLTQQEMNNTDFVAGSITDVIQGKIPPRDEEKPVIFSPFGLGILDLSLGNYVKDESDKKGLGINIKNFFH